MTPFSIDSLTNFTLAEAPTHYPSPASPNSKLSCSLRWRRGKLWVSAFSPAGSIPLPALASEEWFRACLMRSQAQAIVVDPELGTASINLWLKACEEAGKPMYLRIPSMASLPQKQKPLAWWLKGMCDRSVAALLLFLLSPLLLIFIGLMKLQNNNPVFDIQWRVGERGKLFRVLKWRSGGEKAEKLPEKLVSGEKIHKSRVNSPTPRFVEKTFKFPIDIALQLLSVLRGDMSLVGPRAWTIHEAVMTPLELRHRLNALPGMTGMWQLKMSSNQPNRRLVEQQDLRYLKEWTVIQDLKLLVLSIGKVFTGTAYF